MPWRKHAAQANIKNLQIAHQKHIKRNQDDIEGEFIQCHQKYNSTVSAQAISPRESTPPSLISTECVLDPEITDFCSRLNITPVITEFHDEDDNDLDVTISNHSSDIEDESELKKFMQTLQMAQKAALMRGNKNKRQFYSKKSKTTLKRRKLLHIDMVSKGFLPLEEYIRRKGVPVKYNKPTPQLDKIDLRDESEEGSDDAIALDQDTCTNSSISSVSEVESKGSLPGNLHNVQRHLRNCIYMEFKESSEDDNKTRTASKHLEDLRHKVILVQQEAS